MTGKSTTRTFFVALLLTFALAASAFADTLRLKDGSIIKGRIISFTEGRFTVLIGSGSRQRQMVFFADEVESIEFDGIGPAVARSNAPSYNDASVSKAGTAPAVQPTPAPVPSSAPAQPVNRTPEPVQTSAPTGASRGIVINVKVLADNTSNGWTNSGLVVRKGQRVKIVGTGRVSLGQGRSTTPAGLPGIADRDKLMQSEQTGALIAVIGDDNNDFLLIGSSREFVATRDGSLFLGVNEGNLEDNSGAFDVTIEVDAR